MNATNLAGLVILAYVVVHVIEALADLLDMRRLVSQPSSSAADVYDEADYVKMQQHSSSVIKLGLIESSVSLGVLIVFWLAGGFGWVAELSADLLGEGLLGGLLFAGLLYVGGQFVRLPFAIYHTFGIEQRFGFNTTTPGLFLADEIKSLLVTAVLGGGLFALVSLVFEHGGQFGWLAAWAAVVIFSGVMMVVGPTLILPLFNKFEKLPEGELREGVLRLAERCGFPLGDIFVMDGSRRSNRANAFFVGFGRGRRIVLFDTLLRNNTQEELLAILAHEVGHWRLRHLAKRLSFSALAAAVGLWLASMAIVEPALYEAFGVAARSTSWVPVGLVLFSIAASPLMWVAGICSAAISRRHEYEADAFAIQTTSESRWLADALVKLSRDHLTNLDPHPLVVFLHYSHPTLRQRLAAMGSTVREGQHSSYAL